MCLNDVVMNAALQHICARCPTCFALSISEVTREKKKAYSDNDLSSYDFVLIPVHMAVLQHWLIQVVQVDLRDDNPDKWSLKAIHYDPLSSVSNILLLERK